jgi:hypothetical protein
MKIIIIVLLALFTALSCANNRQDKTVYRNQNQYLIEDVYNNFGQLKYSKSYNKDTIPNGAEIFYYPNGKIEKWAWYNALIGEESRKKYAFIFFYFNENGDLDSTNGTPFIRPIITKSGYVAIEMVNPPNVKYIFGYKDFIGDKVVFKQAYEPAVTDSTSWVTLEKHKFEQGHTYKVYYYILNDKGKIKDSMSRELGPPSR